MTLLWIIIAVVVIGAAWYLMAGKKKGGPSAPKAPQGPSTPPPPPETPAM
ncbi:MAG: hypothetical protein Q8P08_01350 [bacterium]|nr:hypothetical protein [bacterium]